jgi:hypothetical protein
MTGNAPWTSLPSAIEEMYIAACERIAQHDLAFVDQKGILPPTRVACRSDQTVMSTGGDFDAYPGG